MDESGNYCARVKLYENGGIFKHKAYVIVTVSKWMVDDMSHIHERDAAMERFKRSQVERGKKRKR